jgi:hypothetical protein
LTRALHENDQLDNSRVEDIANSFYFDDILYSKSDQLSAVEIVETLKKMLSDKGFKLTLFISNDNTVLQNIAECDHAKEVGNFKISHSSSALGVSWNVETDSFYFKVGNIFQCRGTLTRRVMLSTLSSIFDPLVEYTLP